MEREIKPYYLSPGQQRILSVSANTSIVIAGRGWGKTTNILANRSFKLIHSMPRCTINIYAETYRNLLTQTLKELKYGWAKIGFFPYDEMKKTGHFVHGRMPPKSWTKPVRMPDNPEFCIFCYNGTVLQLLSQGVSNNNGGSAQAMLSDEARKLDKSEFDQVYLAMRDDTYWKGNPDYMSLTLTSDQPILNSEQWLFDYEKQMDNQQIELILQHQYKYDKLLIEYHNKKTTETHRKVKLQPKLNKLKATLNILRKDSVLFAEYPTIENIHGVGVEYINNLFRILPYDTFKISVLNQRSTKPPNCFYPSFDIKRNTYNTVDINYMLSSEFNPDEKPNCKLDSDLLTDVPIELALDCGGNINVLVCGQDNSDEFRFINGMHVKTPEKLSHLAHKFSDYYNSHPNRDIILYIDQTDKPTGPVSVKLPYEEFVDNLEQRGWNVEVREVGLVPSPMERYNFINALYAEAYTNVPKIKYHKHHCENVIISIEKTEVKQGKTGWEKEKKYEKNQSLPQEKTTHYSDASDKMLYIKFKELISGDYSNLYQMINK